VEEKAFRAGTTDKNAVLQNGNGRPLGWPPGINGLRLSAIPFSPARPFGVVNDCPTPLASFGTAPDLHLIATVLLAARRIV
jgi:hypothetical protein